MPRRKTSKSQPAKTTTQKAKAAEEQAKISNPATEPQEPPKEPPQPKKKYRRHVPKYRQCPICFGRRKGVGIATRTSGRARYYKCDQCAYSWAYNLSPEDMVAEQTPEEPEDQGETEENDQEPQENEEK